MKVLIWGGEARYRADLPHAVQSLPLELVFCPREQPLESMFPQHADTVFLFVDAIAPVDDALMDRMPGLRLIHSEGWPITPSTWMPPAADPFSSATTRGATPLPLLRWP